MKHGFLRVACSTPSVTVADCESNAKSIIENAKTACKNGAEIIVFPELCISGYTCSDLFLQDALERAAASALEKIAQETKDLDATLLLGQIGRAHV